MGGDDDKSYIKIGPVGNSNGNPWDEKGHGNIFQIFVSHNDEINSIQFQYAENENLVLSEIHGTNNGFHFDAVKLNFPKEYITWISGHMAYSNSHICSLTFGTNCGEYGPFGRSSSYDREFSFRLSNHRQFGGFHGTADRNSVKSIGVYLKLVQNLDYNNHCTDDVKPTEGENWEMVQ